MLSRFTDLYHLMIFFILVPIPNNMEVLGEVVPAATVGVGAEVLSEVPGVPPKPPMALEVFPITIQKL